MNPFFQQLLINSSLTGKIEREGEKNKRKQEREIRIRLKQITRDTIFICLGIFSAAFGLKGFLLTNRFIDGGATGIGLLITELTSWPLYILLPIINFPFVFFAYRLIGKSFAIKTAFAITGLALVLGFISFPDVTKDNLLVAIFGGFFIGAGIGLTIRGGAVIDGTEVLAIYLSKKLQTTVGDIIIIINILIFGAAAYFLSIELALYSMITYLSASKTLDFVIEGIEEYHGVTIISKRSQEIRKMLVEDLGRGVTLYASKGGHGKSGHKGYEEILFTVVTRLELNKLTSEVERIDPDAFMVMNRVKDTKGGMIKKKPMK